MKQGLKKSNTLLLFFITTAFSLAVFFVILGADLASAQWSGPTAEPPLENRPGYIWNTYGPDVDQQPNSSISVSEKVVSPQFCLPNDTTDNCINAWSDLDITDDDWSINGLDVYRRGGSVGIGTNSPAQKLDVVGSATSPARIRVSSENNPEIQLHTGPGINDHWAFYTDAATGELRFWNPGVDNTGYNFLYMDKLGQLGLNRKPTQQLDVNGAIRLGATTQANAGAIQWTGTDFVGYNGASWVSLTGSGATGLPTGTASQTLRNNGTGWVASNTLLNNGSQVTVNGNSLVTGQLGVGGLPSTGVHFEIADHGLTPSVMRITSNTANPELQLKYGPAINQHWAMFVNERFVPRDPDQYDQEQDGQQNSFLGLDAAYAQTTNVINPTPFGDTKNDLRFWAENGNSNGQGSVIMTLQQNGNVNIGPSLPTEKLVVEGRGWFQQGLCLGPGKDCITTWPTAGSSLWQQDGSEIYYNDGQVSVGTDGSYTAKMAVIDDTSNPIGAIGSDTPRAEIGSQPAILAVTDRNHSAVWGMNTGSGGSDPIFAGVTGFAQTGDRRYGVGVAAAGSKYGLSAVTDVGVAGHFRTSSGQYIFNDVTRPLALVAQGGGFYVDAGQTSFNCFGPLSMCDSLSPIFEGAPNPDVNITNAGSNFVIAGVDRGPGIEFIDSRPENIMNGDAEDHYQAGFGLAVAPALYVNNLRNGDFAVRGVSGGISLATRNDGDLANVRNRLYVAGENMDNVPVANGTVRSGYIGINTLEPTELLEIKDGGIKLNTTAARPACTNGRRGTVWFQRGALADTIHVCMRRDGSDQWVDITATGGGLQQPVIR